MTLSLALVLAMSAWADDALPRSLGDSSGWTELSQDPAANAPAKEGGSDLAELAKKLSNPVAALISLPIQANWDFGGGPDDDKYGSKFTLNIQPVIPISISDDWNIISRTIVPIISQHNIFPSEDHQAGMGDILQSVFFSPKEPGAGGIIWGAGPAILFPTATDELLGARKWGFGPTLVMLKQDSGWTYGFLFNHLWGSLGSDQRSNISTTFLQPFLAYSPAKGMTVTLNTESTYDWKSDQWTVPINLSISQIIPIGGQLTSFSIGGRYYADTPDGGPDWGIRLVITFLFPK